MRITSKGQVTIPADIRERAGLLPHIEVAFEMEGEVRTDRSSAVAQRTGKRRAPRHSPARPRGCGDEHRRDHGADPRRLSGDLSDRQQRSARRDDRGARWFTWSADAITRAADAARLVINPVIYAEVSVRYRRIEDLDEALPRAMFEREATPFEAAFPAGKAYLAYQRSGGTKRSPLRDFLIGAHAAIADYRLLTRDATRYRTYFPRLDVVAPAWPPSAGDISRLTSG